MFHNSFTSFNQFSSKKHCPVLLFFLLLFQITWLESVINMRALLYSVSRRGHKSYHQVAPKAVTGRYSVDGQSNKGVNYMWNVKDGEENLAYPGTRSDASQFMRQWVMWTYTQQHGPDIGLLADDVANEDALRRDVVKCK